MEYTKGEWATNRYDTIRVDFNRENCAIICGDDSESNAHLIAAAPTMYEALKDVIKANKNAVEWDLFDIEDCQNAIAKAEGKGE